MAPAEAAALAPAPAAASNDVAFDPEAEGRAVGMWLEREEVVNNGGVLHVASLLFDTCSSSRSLNGCLPRLVKPAPRAMVFKEADLNGCSRLLEQPRGRGSERAC